MSWERVLLRMDLDRSRVGQSFYKDVSEGRSVFHISFIRHEADIDVTADVAVRIDVKEDDLYLSAFSALSRSLRLRD
jgi:hypothetical protein